MIRRVSRRPFTPSLTLPPQRGRELVASKTPFPAVILNEVKDLLQQNEEILRYAQNDIWELTHYEFREKKFLPPRRGKVRMGVKAATPILLPGY